tara:strand:- start:3358 stop:3786 length:429 start_codon:yes stop_codon:yes gene_type:complete
MGNYLSSSTTYFIYNRDSKDLWVDKPLITNTTEDLDWHCGRFKHTFFKLSLGTFDFKKIYLYQNRVRLSRAELTVDGQTMSVIHSTSAASDAWENCKRSKLGLKFDKLFKISKKTKFEIVYTKLKYSEKLTGNVEFDIAISE